ncbi:hypothetical protein EIP91_008739 [Steccherinum ochraceum]|uniref:Benzoate 4-monooxygenase cytochrome P450 n=1 Tax=Steccherinum ochraceum TaxID=92696 RepID=A0A4V2MX82_9APHY|nr:hypothetical protein EIP91_008739 [Steccherinum ochraceum]
MPLSLFGEIALISSLISVGGLIVGCLWLLAAWLYDSHGLRPLPGPPLAKISSAWLGWVAHTGRLNTLIWAQHQKYGKIVRIAPNHVSVVDPNALHTIYGHGSKALKSEFYDALTQFGGARSVFTTRSREEHSRKRKFVAHALSMRSVIEFEPTIAKYQQLLIDHWDRMCNDAINGLGGKIGEQTWKAKDGQAWMDCMPWLNFEAFDIIGDLAFGAGFGMVSSGSDLVSVAKSQSRALKSFDTEWQLETETIPAVKTVLDRSEYTTAAAHLPALVRPLMLLLPNHIRGSTAMKKFGTIAVTSIAKRLALQSDKVDLLSKMVEVKDDGGRPMGDRELSAEATTLLIAGSDTTSNSTCGIVFYLAKDQARQSLLQRELDTALGAPTGSGDFNEYGKLYDKVKHLPYLSAAIEEGLRMYTAVGVGFPRIAPPGGLTILGHTLPEGTVVSVPLYSLHKDPDIWGPDADKFLPERWLGDDKATWRKAFAPFQVGPRACIGRNLAYMELFTLVATMFHRYHFVLEDPNQEKA